MTVPGATSWLHGWMEVGTSPGAGALQGRSLCLPTSVPRILKHDVHLQATRSSESALTETVSKEWWGGSPFPTVTLRDHLIKTHTHTQVGEEF